MLQRPDFLEKCELWRSEERDQGVFTDVYDGDLERINRDTEAWLREATLYHCSILQYATISHNYNPPSILVAT